MVRHFGASLKVNVITFCFEGVEALFVVKYVEDVLLLLKPPTHAEVQCNKSGCLDS